MESKRIILALIICLTFLNVNASPDSTKVDLYVGANYSYNSGFGVSSANTGDRKLKFLSAFKKFDNTFSTFVLYDKLPTKTLNNYIINNSIDGNKSKFLYPFVFTELEQNLIKQNYLPENGVNLRCSVGTGVGKKFTNIRYSYAILLDYYNLTSNQISNPIYRHSFRTKYDNKLKNIEYGFELIFQPSVSDIHISRSKINGYLKYVVNKHFKLTMNSDNFIDKYKGNPIERQLDLITFGLTYNY